MKLAKWLLVAIGSCSVFKSIDLLSTPLDGSGTVLYVLGFEIHDRLPNELIPGTAAMFAVMGAIVLLVATVLDRSAPGGHD